MTLRSADRKCRHEIGSCPESSASSLPVHEQVGNAFDNDPTTKYLNRGGVNSGLEFAYAVPTRLSAFIIRGATRGGPSDRSTCLARRA